MGDPLDLLIRKCCAKLRGAEQGAGFFVAPGLMLTCAHVVGRNRLPGDENSQVTLSSGTTTNGRLKSIFPKADLALLEVTAGNHPCVILGQEVWPNEQLLIVGFPVYDNNIGAECDSLTAEYDGRTESSGSEAGQFLLKFKENLVVGGFSGGPLLNLHTGHVIGIVTTTRGRNSAVGGWAIPSELIAAKLPDVPERNTAYAAQTGLWNEALEERLSLLGDRVPYPQPKLRRHDSQGLNRFYYGARVIPLLGRDKEMEILEGFLADKRPFLWCLVTGPGGLGKSRLALELCLRHKIPWRSGFLDQTDDFKFRTWRPNRPTLMVVDYAAARADELGELARSLHERRRELRLPVRLLLLERDKGEGKERWFDRFLGIGSSTKLDATEAAQYPAPRKDPLELGMLTADDLWVLIKFALHESKRPIPDQTQTLEQLHKIDPLRRPLFAALFADAIAAGRDPRQWNREALIRDVLSRDEENYWKPAGITKNDKDLLALATLCGGIDRKNLPEELYSKLTEFSSKRYRVMSGKRTNDRLDPLEPDIPGEMFVLDHLGSDDGETRADWARQVAWNINPPGMFKFLTRAGKDFPDHKTLRVLSHPAKQTAATRIWWSTAALNMNDSYGASGQFEAAHTLYSELRRLAAEHPDEPVLRLRQAQAAYNLVVYGKSSQPATAPTMYSELRKLAAEHPNERVLREIQSQVVDKLILHHGAAGQLATAHTLYDELRKLVAEHVEEPILRALQADSAMALIAVYGNAGSRGTVHALYDDVRKLAADHPDEPELRDSQARACVNLIVFYSKARELRAARALYNELRKLVAEHTDEPALHEPQARAIVYLINGYSDAGQPKSARALYEELRKLVAKHKNEPALRDRQAGAAANLIKGYGNTGQLNEARILYDNLCQLAAKHGDQPGVREARAQAAHNLVIFYGKAGQLATGHTLYDELSQLAAEHTYEPVLREMQALAAYNLIFYYGKAGERGTAQTLYNQLSKLAAEHPNEPVLREIQSQAPTA